MSLPFKALQPMDPRVVDIGYVAPALPCVDCTDCSDASDQSDVSDGGGDVVI